MDQKGFSVVGYLFSDRLLGRLSENQVESVVWGLQRFQAQGAVLEEVNQLITYLRNQQERLDYTAVKAAGLPISSGGIEAANKFISHVRLKRSGAWGSWWKMATACSD